MMVREAFWVSALLVATGACTSKDDGAVNDGVTADAGGATGMGNVTAVTTSNGAGTEGTETATSGGGSTNVSTQSGGASSGGSGAVTGEAGAAGTSGAAPVGPIDCRSEGDGQTTIVFVNRCAETVEARGSDLEAVLVLPGDFVCQDIGGAEEELPSKRYWGFIGTDPGAEHHTLAEFTFNTDFNDFDWYNISHVDAFNLPMQIVPVLRDDCDTLTCADDLVLGCPEVGQFYDEAGDLVACVSPDRDNGESAVAQYFEACDDAYAWSGDDQNGEDPSPVRACAGEDWDIVFCPDGVP